MNTRWQLQEAKAKFSQLVKAAEKAPQEITVHGKPTAVLMSIDEYLRRTKAPPNHASLFDVAKAAGVTKLDLVVERATTADPERSVF